VEYQTVWDTDEGGSPKASPGELVVGWARGSADPVPTNAASAASNTTMTRSIKHLFGNKLGASDGEIGHVKDFYFDDQNWAIRYLVANTGSWLPGRQILLSPHSFIRPEPDAGKVFRVALTKQQIENSPAFDFHKPVSRQSEEEYYTYYGWPFYWQGGGLWGMSGLPVLGPVTKSPPARDNPAKAQGLSGDEIHLRSAQAVTGYHLQAVDGIIGHVSDFMVDDRSWAIEHLVIKTGHRISGNEVQIPTGSVTKISWDDSTVFVGLTMDAVSKGPAPQPTPA
jgi:hypothetical protein